MSNSGRCSDASLKGTPAEAISLDDEKSTMFYLRQGKILLNLLIMAYMWIACSFCYYLINLYVKYLPGNIYQNSMSSGAAEALAYVTSGFLLNKFGVKRTFTGLLILSLFGGICIIFLGERVGGAWMSVFVIAAKFGIAGGWTLVYCGTMIIFPTLFCGTAIGFCNFGARFMTIFAPQVAERPAPWPMIMFSAFVLLGIILIQFVRILSKPTNDNKK